MAKNLRKRCKRCRTLITRLLCRPSQRLVCPAATTPANLVPLPSKFGEVSMPNSYAISFATVVWLVKALCEGLENLWEFLDP